MNLLIHDLSLDKRHEAEEAYPGWKVICDDGAIRPCVGCFSCWNRTPGRCVIRDGYEDIGALFHRAEEVVVISRYTWGGFSGFVKNVFDRCLGYALPHFEVIDGETQHKKRYDEVSEHVRDRVHELAAGLPARHDLVEREHAVSSVQHGYRQQVEDRQVDAEETEEPECVPEVLAHLQVEGAGNEHRAAD